MAARAQAKTPAPPKPKPTKAPARFNPKMMSSSSNEWETPGWLFERVHQALDLTVDVAATPGNTKLPRYYTADTDGLGQSWQGERVWANPPYGKNPPVWIAKAIAEHAQGQCDVAMLVAARVETIYWHELVFPKATLVLFFKRRLAHEVCGVPVTGSSFPSALLLFLQTPEAKKHAIAALGDLGVFHSPVLD